MKLNSRFSRRILSALALSVALLLIPLGLHAADNTWSRDDAAHLLRRAGFGGTPTQIDQIHGMGRDAAVDYLIGGDRPDGTSAPFTPVVLPAFVQDPDLDTRIQGAGAQYEIQALRAWVLDRMVRTDKPLEEKMTLFWHGIFTSGLREVRNVRWLADQDALLRRESIGNYKRLTREIIHDPAMIKYLNNDDNKKGNPNENLARELMELFTMGEGNGYTEADIPEVARALTGMTVFGRYGGQAQFSERTHDDGPKTIFGKTGNYKPDDVVELIFDRPEPATYLSKRLWQFFAMPDPSAQDIDLVADALKKNNWDLAPALRVMFTSPDFYGDKAKFVLIKSPVELEAMSLRLLEEPPQERMMTAAAFVLRPLGQELFQPPNVKGWPGGEHWITSTAIFTRYTLTAGMANGVLGANVGRFGGQRPPNAAKANPTANTAPATQPSDPRLARNAKPSETATASADKNDARRAMIEKLREEQREKVQAKLAQIPPMPSADQLVVPAKLFSQLPKEPTAQQVVDAAVARFIQHPLPSDKTTTLVQSLGKAPLELGDASTDRRVRQMIGALMSTPEYQVE